MTFYPSTYVLWPRCFLCFPSPTGEETGGETASNVFNVKCVSVQVTKLRDSPFVDVALWSLFLNALLIPCSFTLRCPELCSS